MIFAKFCKILLGAELHIHTEHCNIITDIITPEHVIYWFHHNEQFNHCLSFILGKDVFVAGTLSWLYYLNVLMSQFFQKESKYSFKMTRLLRKLIFVDDPFPAECFLNFPSNQVHDKWITNGSPIMKVKLTKFFVILKHILTDSSTVSLNTKIYLLCVTTQWQKAIVENTLVISKLQDLTHTILIPCHACIPWFKNHLINSTNLP